MPPEKLYSFGMATGNGQGRLVGLRVRVNAYARKTRRKKVVAARELTDRIEACGVRPLASSLAAVGVSAEHPGASGPNE